ncbi:MAG: hypothetical protein HW391_2015 [Chloroflexi bacterium]|nr:hypothetical protein [Chloroflexota bacterium]
MTGTSDSTHFRPPLTVRVAAFLFLFLGLAFGASVPFVLAHLDRFGELPMNRRRSWPSAGPSSGYVPPTWSPVSGSGEAIDGEPGWGSPRRPSHLPSARGSPCPSSSSACRSAWPSCWRVAEAWADVLATGVSCADLSSPLPGRGPHPGDSRRAQGVGAEVDGAGVLVAREVSLNWAPDSGHRATTWRHPGRFVPGSTVVVVLEP